METPTSDFGSNEDLSTSDASTPSTCYEPFQPKFKIKVTEPIKDGETLTYTVKTSETSNGKEYTVVRQYEDFDYLHHCLVTGGNSNGIIIPPLPPNPVLDPKDASSKSKKQLGNKSKTLIGDDFNKDCRNLETYLRQVICHPILGMSLSLESFLLEKEAPKRIKVKKSFLGKLSSVVEEARKAHHRDIDDYFQNERIWANEHAKNLNDLSENMNKVIYGEQRISGAYAHLSTALNLGGGYEEEELIKANRILVKFSEALEDAKHGCDVDWANDENTLGSHLDLASRYSEALKDMFFQRTCLMVDYEEANRALDKAKPNRKTEAEQHKLAAERAFDDCSEVARREIQRYKHQRIVSFQVGLTLYAEAKVKTARDTYALLAKSLSYFKQLQL